VSFRSNAAEIVLGSRAIFAEKLFQNGSASASKGFGHLAVTKNLATDVTLWF
jgi:hypothetical protein